MRLVHALLIALSTYSKVPVPQAEWTEENKAYSMAFFPLVGLMCGGALALWLRLCDALLPGGVLRGAIGAAIPLLVTGGIHMDGFMDTLDALASWQPKERRLEILKDSHTGAFAVMGCCAYLLAMAGILSEADAGLWAGLCACFALSRALSALALLHLPKAKATGMLAGFAASAHVRAVTAACAAWAALAVSVLSALFGVAGALSAASAFACLMHYRRMSLRYFGGVTGDLAGWFLQTAELVSLSVLVIGGKLL
ncbi:MAG: adenosylcobinamide-GDP ribazoletransferase [Clostridia bacterium]|nr:adenosylcobinamide-GDP ribazoletransferase [Clostridia bacterium]